MGKIRLRQNDSTPCQSGTESQPFSEYCRRAAGLVMSSFEKVIPTIRCPTRLQTAIQHFQLWDQLLNHFRNTSDLLQIYFRTASISSSMIEVPVKPPEVMYQTDGSR